MTEYFVAFWNLENLFDSHDSPLRPAWLQKELKSELAGWSDAVRDKKITQLSKIIQQLNGGTGPDVLGICEVENKNVMDLLVTSLTPLGRNYAVKHHDTSDQRGIDVAFIYDSDKLVAEDEFSHVVLKRTATRDLYQVNFRTTGTDTRLLLIGNHWPARTGGELATEPYRIVAAETLSYWHDRIHEIHGENVAVVTMGDFNDEPFNRSVRDHALAGRSREKVLRADEAPRVLNLMWDVMGDGIGTHYFNNFPNLLDQFWASKGIVNGESGLKVKDGSVTIERVPDMVASLQNSKVKYPRPIPYGRPKKKSTYNPKGYSDHYPISMVLQEA